MAMVILFNCEILSVVIFMTVSGKIPKIMEFFATQDLKVISRKLYSIKGVD